MKVYKGGTLLKDNSSNPFIADCKEKLRSFGFSEDFTCLFAEEAVIALDEYTESFGVGTRISYRLAKQLTRVELKIRIEEEPYDIFSDGREAKRFTIEKLFSRNLNTESVRLTYKYSFGDNIFSVSLPLSERQKHITTDPMILSIVLGVLCGLVCQHIPREANEFIINSVATPILSVVLDMISGTMGPVLFISMTTSGYKIGGML